MQSVAYPLTASYETALRFIAGILPLPETASQGLISGKTLQEELPGLPHLKGEAIEEGSRYLITSEQAIEQHYEALVEAYTTQGRAGVVAYLMPYAAFLPQDTFPIPSTN